MLPYISLSGKQSGVVAFEIGKESITIKFLNGDVYRYTYSSAGKEFIETMKTLAIKQRGLATFISQNNPVYE